MLDAISPNQAAEMKKYILEHGDDLSFTRFFWKGCEPLEGNVVQYHKFAEAFALTEKQNDRFRISEELEVSKGTVRNWLMFEKMPKLAHYLLAYLSLGVPIQDRSWLTLRCTHGHAIPLGPWVQVPSRIRRWKDLESTYEQIEQTTVAVQQRDFAVGFFLGMMLGDANKSKPRSGHRHVDLTLSMEYDTNVRLGEHTCWSAAALGLKMHRVADLARPDNKPNGFYCWVSESSPLVDWILNACLGLEDTEHTTYDAVRMDWAIEAPDSFRRGLLQDVAESDGSVSIASQTVELWVEPSRNFIANLLTSFGVRSFRSREALSIAKSQVRKAHEIPLFSPSLRTTRFLEFERLAQASHIERGKRLPPEKRSFIIDEARQGLSVPGISKVILRRFGLSLSFETAQRWSKKVRFLEE